MIPIPQIPEGVSLERDLIFNTDPARPLRLHLLRPGRLAQEPAPALVFVHGGAFRTGSRDDGIVPLIPFAQRGYVCASLEYRLSGEAVWPAQIEDVKCGVRFLRANAERFGLDPEHIGAWGPSAGGHLVSMLGVTGEVAELEGEGGWAGVSSRVQAVCDWFGPTDFLQMNKAGSVQDHDAPDSPESELVSGPIQENPEKVALANPLTYITPGRTYPPFLIVHGTADPLVPFNQSELLVAALRTVGAEVRFHPIAGAGHGGPAFEREEITDLVQAFFDRNLRRGEAGQEER
jgi:acetyl esterase/lipase